ncbi:thioredoxin reductase, partial [Listeria monocytogenes]|jgi:thioredoxin reductase (NADPH)|nr:thioredoxin reductase [Listeria monocytogenes]
VAACQRIASINPHVEAEMVDISLFPELKKEKKIMSVPAMLIDGEQMIFGSKTMTEIIEALA